MKLTKYEQSGFILETDKGFRLALDIGMMTPLETLDGITVDAMLVSHIHRDHFTLEQIKKLSPKTLYLNQECMDEVSEKLPFNVVIVKAGDNIDLGGGMSTQFFEVDHGPNVSVRPKENHGFLIETEGKRIYFGGDIFYESGIDVTGLEVDYALLPVGTFYTFGPQEAFEFAKKFKKITKVVPMHYEKKLGMRDRFIELAKDIFETR